MIEWGLAVKIATGGFSLVFMLLTLLAFSIWLTKEVVTRIEAWKLPEKK